MRAHVLQRWALSLAAAVLATASQAQTAPVTMSHGLFTDVRLLAPVGTVQQFVLQLSEGGAAAAAEEASRRSMLANGAMVAVVPLTPFLDKLSAQGGTCSYAAGAFENLARHLQASQKLSTYFEPIVVGAGDNAAIAYAVTAQAPAGTFSATLTTGFCPRLDTRPPLCATNGLRWRNGADGRSVEMVPGSTGGAPWTAMASASAPPAACSAADAQAFVEQTPSARWVADATGFDAAFAQIATRRLALEPPPAQLSDLPVVEVPVRQPGRRFAVLLSGDGGWATIDKEIAAALAARGMPVAGFDSLRYFWSARTPEALAADLDRLVRYYAARWQRSEVVLIGFSQGADVLPFAINRLPARTRAAVKLTALLSLGEKASFEFRVTNWLGPGGDRPILPEVQKLQAATTLCIHGADDRNTLCPRLAPRHARVLKLPGDHHLGGAYEAVATQILGALPP